MMVAMPDEIETVTVDEATADYYIASAATWAASPEWRAVATAFGRIVTTTTANDLVRDLVTDVPADRALAIMTRTRRLGFIELTDPPARRTPPRPRTWPRGKWFALSRRRRKSPPIGW